MVAIIAVIIMLCCSGTIHNSLAINSTKPDVDNRKTVLGLLRALTSDMTYVKNKVVSLTTDVASMKNEMSNVGSEVSSMKSKMSDVGSEVVALRRKESEVEEKMNAMQHGVNATESNVEEMKKKVVATHDDMKKMKTSQETIAKEVSVIEKSVGIFSLKFVGVGYQASY